MKEHKSERADDTGQEGSGYSGDEQAKDVTQLIELKWRAIEPLDESRDDYRPTGIGRNK